jgi:hypothetical protein
VARPTDEQPVSAEAAITFVRRSRKDGGFVRLVASGLLVSVAVMSGVGIVFHPLFALGTLLAGALSIPLLRHGLRSHTTNVALSKAAQLQPPLAAALSDRRLLIGQADAPVASWSTIPVTAKEARHIRTLALPAARVVPPRK